MLSRYEKKAELGSGTYGIVWLCLDKEHNREIALKQMKQDQRDEGLSVSSVHEVGVLLELKHKNIVDLYDFFFHDTFLYLVFEYCNDDLTKYMENNPNMKPQTIKSFIHQILQGLNFCHQHHILHRDMKPQNIFVTKDDVIKLGDFGLARLTTIKSWINSVILFLQNK